MTVHADLEVAVVAFLTADTTLAALAAEIGTRTPTSTESAWVRVALLDDRAHASSRADHLSHALVQLDCYGGADRTQADAQASQIALTIRDLISAFAATGVVATAKFASMRPLPDDTFDPARARWIVTFNLTHHP